MQRICLILFPDFPMLAAELVTETLRLANLCSGKLLFECQWRSVTKSAVRSTHGAVFTPSMDHWYGAKTFDLILLCADTSPIEHISPGLRAFLNKAARRGTVLGGLGAGSQVLAELGFLDDHNAVLHGVDEEKAQNNWSGVTISDGAFCLDDKRLTAAGGTSAGDAMLAWIADVASPDLARATAEAMADGVIREPHERQQIVPSADPVLERMGQMMEQHMADPLPLTEIAEALDLSLKQLRLRSQRGLGVTPSTYYHHLRLRAALEMVKATQMSMTEIATATGFATLASFSKSFSAEFGTSPRSLRATMVRR